MATSVWNGSISFGLVSVPVKLFTAVQDHDVSFHQYSRETGARIRYRKVDADTGDEVTSGDIVKGWDAGDGRLVMVDSKELGELDPTKSELLDILDFVDLEQIDPVFYDRPYNVVPTGEASAKAYRLLVAAMTSSRKVAIARFVMRTKEHLAALRPRDGMLVLSTMRFDDEVLDPRMSEGAALVEAAEVRDRELEMALQLIEDLTTDFDPAVYEDEHQARIVEFLEAKAEGQSVEMAPKREQGRVIDLTAALKQSLEARDGRARPARKTAADDAGDDASTGDTDTGGDEAKSADDTGDDLAAMSKDELYDLAQARNVSGRSSMTKDELIEALRAGEADASDAVA